MKRIKSLLQELSSMDLDGMLITSRYNITYLSGFTGEAARMLVSSKGCVLLTDGRYTEQAANEVHADVEVFKWIRDNRYGAETYQRFIDAFGIKHLGFEGDLVSYSTFEMLQKGLSVELEATDDLVAKQRQIKDSDEIEILREACQISDKALELTVPTLKAGITEKELAAHLEFNLKMNGADDISFDTIILTGSRTSLLHGNPSSEPLKNGDFVQFDFGALYKGYHADMSRTFVVGKASQEQKDFYKMMQSAEMEAVKSLKPGIEGKLVDAAARRAVSDQHINHYYPGIGHGVGLEIHEQPFIKHDADFTVESGMVLTIEPGVYIPGWGGMRIEDTVLITESGHEILTCFPRELIEL